MSYPDGMEKSFVRIKNKKSLQNKLLKTAAYQFLILHNCMWSDSRKKHKKIRQSSLILIV